MSSFATPRYVLTFSLIIDWLLAAMLLASGARNVDIGTLVALRLRIRKLAAAFIRLAVLVAQGKYVPRTRTPRADGGPKPAKDPSPPGALPKLPRRFGWLYQMMRPEASHTISQMDNWLRHSGVEELVATVPQAGRILRSLCHMLGLKSAILALPKKQRTRSKAEPGAEPGAEQGVGPEDGTEPQAGPSRPKRQPKAWPYKGSFTRNEVEPGHTFPPMGTDAEVRAARLAAWHAERRRRKNEKLGPSPA